MALYIPVSDESSDDPQMQRIEGKSVSLEMGEVVVEPPYVKDARLETTGNTKPQSDQCGHTEVHKNGDSNWTLTINGIITDQQLEKFKTIVRSGNTVFVTTDLESGNYVVEDPSINQSDDLSFLHVPQDGDITQVGNAFTFQLSLKEQSSSIERTDDEDTLGDRLARAGVW